VWPATIIPQIRQPNNISAVVVNCLTVLMMFFPIKFFYESGLVTRPAQIDLDQVVSLESFFIELLFFFRKFAYTNDVELIESS
jgi:hypothetical protein